MKQYFKLLVPAALFCLAACTGSNVSRSELLTSAVSQTDAAALEPLNLLAPITIQFDDTFEDLDDLNITVGSRHACMADLGIGDEVQASYGEDVANKLGQAIATRIQPSVVESLYERAVLSSGTRLAVSLYGQDISSNATSATVGSLLSSSGTMTRRVSVTFELSLRFALQTDTSFLAQQVATSKAIVVRETVKKGLSFKQPVSCSSLYKGAVEEAIQKVTDDLAVRAHVFMSKNQDALN